MAYSHNAFTRDKRESRKRQESYGSMADGLTQTNEIASKSQRDVAKPDDLTQTSETASKHREIVERCREEIELERVRESRYIWSYLNILVTKLFTDGLTELFLKSLSQLKKNQRQRQLDRAREN